MKIRHRLETPTIEEVKERIVENRLTPVVIAVVVTLLGTQLFNRPQKIHIHIHTDD